MIFASCTTPVLSPVSGICTVVPVGEVIVVRLVTGPRLVVVVVSTFAASPVGPEEVVDVVVRIVDPPFI